MSARASYKFNILLVSEYLSYACFQSHHFRLNLTRRMHAVMVNIPMIKLLL